MNSPFGFCDSDYFGMSAELESYCMIRTQEHGNIHYCRSAVSKSIYSVKIEKGYSPSWAFSLIDLTQGYLLIFVVGLDVGGLILPANPPSMLSIQFP
jgi:hypothetical protein